MTGKKCFLAFLLISNLGIINATAAPPDYQVISAEIDIVQGAKIYGNGKMQSVLRVRYELAEGVRLTNVQLKEFGSKELLEKIGWEESTTDNGFDHNIIGTRLKNPTQDIIDEKNKVRDYKNIYVSTKNKNSWLLACFELATQKNEVTAIYSTCKDEGIIKGTARLFSARPKIYSARDFIFKKADRLLNIIDDLDLTLHTLTPGNNIPRNIYFSVINFNYPPDRFMDNTGEKLLLHAYFQPHTAYKKNISYMISWLLKPKVNTSFQVITDALKVVTTDIPSTFYPHAVLHILNVRYRKNSYIVNNWRCRAHLNQLGKEICGVPTQGSIKEELKDYKSEIEPLMKNKLSAKLVIQDNYGTQHHLTTFYGFGEYNKTLFIE